MIENRETRRPVFHGARNSIPVRVAILRVQFSLLFFQLLLAFLDLFFTDAQFLHHGQATESPLATKATPTLSV